MIYSDLQKPQGERSQEIRGRVQALKHQGAEFNLNEKHCTCAFKASI